MTFTALHFISLSASSSPFPVFRASFRVAQREVVVVVVVFVLVEGGNLVALTNEASWDRQPTRGRMFHGDSGKGEREQKRASETPAAFCVYASQQQQCLAAAA